MEIVSIPISIVSLAISMSFFWLAFLRRGRLAMTMPTIVFFDHDGAQGDAQDIHAHFALQHCHVEPGCRGNVYLDAPEWHSADIQLLKHGKPRSSRRGTDSTSAARGRPPTIISSTRFTRMNIGSSWRAT